MTKQPDADWWPLKFNGNIATINLNMRSVRPVTIEGKLIKRILVSEPGIHSKSPFYIVSIYPAEAFAARPRSRSFADLFDLRVYLMTILKRNRVEAPRLP